MRHSSASPAGVPGTERPGGLRRRPLAAALLPVSASMLVAAGLGGLAAPAGAAAIPAAAKPDSFAQVNLVANTAALHPRLVDKNLTNAWGLAGAPGVPLWVSDNGSGLASVYGGGVGAGAVTLDLTVPVPGGHPTGQVLNTGSAFPVGGTAGSSASFIVDTDSIGKAPSPGEIAAWNGGASFVVEDSPTGGPGGKTLPKAVFKGLALANTPKAGPELFAADVANAKIDVFNRDFHPLKTPAEFRDPKIPAGWAPFNVQLLGGKLYVTYGKQNKAKTDVVRGAHLGFVDIYTVNGQLIKHLVAHGPLNAPWGLAIAPSGFGPFGGALLVGNLGNGWINAFNPATGKFLGFLKTRTGAAVAIGGLWGIEAGNGAFGGSGTLVFSAGPSRYVNGLVGVLKPAAPAPGGGGW